MLFLFGLLKRKRRFRASNEEGFFIDQTIFDYVITSMQLWKDEIFAPVLSIVRVKNLEEAIELTNESDVGEFYTRRKVVTARW
ncbi:aldehyde dehydrogenase family protein [Guptibacillus hwajinpoensis]|uniref:aldehyde dehydrogenase family protein n=1 Tax=Guptibacillus hwajinpoensis TaxID=208199 RepID=UPI003CD0C8CD